MFPVTDAEADDSAELKLLGSPFIRLSISCVAAVNCGMYIGRLPEGEDDGAPTGGAFGAGLGVKNKLGALPFVGPPCAPAPAPGPAAGAGFDMAEEKRKSQVVGLFASAPGIAPGAVPGIEDWSF